MRQTLFVLGLLSLNCRNGLAPTGDVQGTWVADFNLPGANLVLSLAQLHDSVAGHGTYQIEAGRAGTVRVDGAYDRPNITLAIHYDYGLTENYTGAVVDSQHMSGMLGDSSGHAFALAFTRR